MRLFLVLTAAALALATPVAAKGKVLKSATICGSHGCTTITDSDRLRELPTGGETTADAPPPSEYYLVELDLGTGTPNTERFRLLYVPSQTILAVYALKRDSLVWLPIYGSAIQAMEDSIGDLEPFRPPVAWPKDVPLRPAPAGFDWPLVSGSLLVAFALGLTTLLLVKRGREVLPRI
jgi:hypothetical protein